MDYSRLVESLKKEGTNRICFDCGVVGTTYASLNFGTFVCSQCAGILRGLNFKVKAFGISIFTLDEYEFLLRNGNDKARKVWLGSFDPYKDEKPNPKKYDNVKQHIIKKYKLKKYYKESKGIHFINKSIEDDIKDPLDFVNKCRVKNIDIGPLWTRKTNNNNNDEGFDFSNNNIKNNNSNNLNINKNKNIDLLGDLFDINNGNDSKNNINNNNNNTQKIDINNLLEGLNFNSNSSNTINNNSNNNINNNSNIAINISPNNINNNINNNSLNSNNNTNINDNIIKNEKNLGFDFSYFGKNLENTNSNNNVDKNNIVEKKEENIENDNLGFDFGDNNQNQKIDNKKNNDFKDNILDLNFGLSTKIKNIESNNSLENTNKQIDNDFGFNFDSSNKQNNIDNNNKNESNFNFDFSQKQNNNSNIINDNLGFDFGQQEKMDDKNNNKNNFTNLGLDFHNEKNEEIKDGPKNINSLFEDPNSEKINDIKKIQEKKRKNDYQNLTFALDNQNQFDKKDKGNFDFTSIINK